MGRSTVGATTAEKLEGTSRWWTLIPFPFLFSPFSRSSLFALTATARTLYRPRSRADNTFGSVRVCVSVRLSVGALLFEPFDL